MLRSCVEGMCCCTMWWVSWRRRKVHGVMWREAWARCRRPSPAPLDPTVQTFSQRRYFDSEVIMFLLILSRNLRLRPTTGCGPGPGRFRRRSEGSGAERWDGDLQQSGAIKRHSRCYLQETYSAGIPEITAPTQRQQERYYYFYCLWPSLLLVECPFSRVHSRRGADRLHLACYQNQW